MKAEPGRNTILCHNCGAEIEDDQEMCRSCGNLKVEPCPNPRFNILSDFLSWMKIKGLHGVNQDQLFTKDPMVDPEYSALSGNIFNENEK